MLITKVKKEKVIKEFREELKRINIVNRAVYDKPFFDILNSVYKFSPREIKCHISRFNTLTFLIIVDHTYIYLEWSPMKNIPVLLNITKMDENFDDGGTFSLSLENSLLKINDIWNNKKDSN